MDPVSLIAAIAGLITAIGGTGIFTVRTVKRRRARKAAAAAGKLAPLNTGRGRMPAPPRDDDNTG
jgi:hypothetical protein